MNSLKKSVIRLKCETESNGEGTAFLITDKMAITAWHCVGNCIEESEGIILEFLNFNEPVKRIARVLDKDEEKDIAILIFDEEIRLEIEFLTLVKINNNLNLGTMMNTFGYPSANRDVGYPLNLRLVDVSAKEYWYFEPDSTLEAFEGYSGSPICYDGKVMGIALKTCYARKADGTINDFSIKVISNSYIEELLNRNGIQLSDYPICDFTKREDYIVRKVAPYEIVRGMSYSHFRFSNTDKKMKLIDVFRSNKQVVLLGEAGCGKSFELQNLACEISTSMNLLPVFIKLDSYMTEDIVKLFPKMVRDIDVKYLFLIFDGYDEIESVNINKFARNINSFIKENPDVHILISARSNFYKFSDKDDEGGTFSGFKEYGICPLINKDISEYLDRYEISCNEFENAIENSELEDLVYSPFYFIELVQIYRDKNIFPNRADVMEKIIKNRFILDKSKYVNTSDIEDEEFRIIQYLQKLALAMQCMQKTFLTEMQYQELLSSEDRKLLKYSGIWNKNKDGNWTFIHNNFREYLVAKHLAKQFVAKIQFFITFEEDREKIKESWVNVLSFLALIYKDGSLFQWIKKNAPLLVVKFEAKNIDVSECTKLFVNIFNIYKERNMWITRSAINLYELVDFANNTDTLSFLLSEIQNPYSFRSQYNAIMLLRHFDNLYGLEDRVRNILFLSCEGEETRNEEKDYIIIALAELKLNTADTTLRLFRMFEILENPYISHGMYSYLLDSNLQDDYIELFLQGIKIYADRKSEDLNCLYLINKGIQGIEKYETLEKVFNFFILENENRYLRNEKEVFIDLCFKAIGYYNNGHRDIFEVVFRLLVDCIPKDYILDFNVFIRFFNETNTVNIVFEKLLNIDLKIEYYTKLSMLEDLANEECFEIFLKWYQSRVTIENRLFVDFTRRMDKANIFYEIYKKAIDEKEGVKVEVKCLSNVNTQERRDYTIQSYFNTLFDKAHFSKLLNEMISFYGNPQIRYAELISDWLNGDPTKRREDIEYLRISLRKMKFEDSLVCNFLKNIDWEKFSIEKIFFVLRDYDEKLHISKQQQFYIEEYCQREISSININDIVTYKKSEYNQMRKIRYIAYFSSYFDIKYNDEIYLDMLMLPASFFNLERHDYSYSNKFPEYIIKNLEYSDIKNRVYNNLNCKKIEGEIANTYLNYCHDNGWNCAVELAESICWDSNLKEYNKQIAFKYLLKIKKSEYIYETFLPMEDNELLKIIAGSLAKEQNPKLLKNLIEVNQKSERREHFLVELITMNSIYGLQVYYDIAKEKNAIPDYSDPENYPVLTVTIEEVQNVELLPILKKLIVLLFSLDFKDNKTMGLYHCLWKGILNMSSDSYIEVKKMLLEVLEECSDNQELCAFGYSLLEDVQKKFYEANDIPWEFQKVKNFCFIG